jgi:acetyl-CoA carboxylase biotin carboxyl carrier protein
MSSSSEKDSIDLEAIRALARVVDEHNLSELSLSLPDGANIVLRKGVAAPAVVHAAPAAPHFVHHASPLGSPALAPVPGPAAPSAAAQNGQYQYEVSPFVGTFYRAPSPEAAVFVEVGQKVKKGQVLCIVEAMKLMNEIEAEHEGTVVACMVENAQPVEYGQQLFKISAS